MAILIFGNTEGTGSGTIIAPFFRLNGLSFVDTDLTVNFGGTAFSHTVPTGFSGPGGTWSSTRSAANIALSNGDLTANNTNTNSQWENVFGSQTFIEGTGKFYWEASAVYVGSGGPLGGLIHAGFSSILDPFIWVCRAKDPSVSHSVDITNHLTGNFLDGFDSGDTMMAALDLVDKKFFAGYNGTWDLSGDPAAGTNPVASW